MKTFLNVLKKTLSQTRGMFPSALPMGATDLDNFSNSIFETYNLPNQPSYHHAIASMIMHLGPTTAYKSKFYFAVSVKKAMSNQVAFEKIQSLKKQEQDYINSTVVTPIQKGSTNDIKDPEVQTVTSNVV